jgi:hypothetical protein
LVIVVVTVPVLRTLNVAPVFRVNVPVFKVSVRLAATLKDWLPVMVRLELMVAPVTVALATVRPPLLPRLRVPVLRVTVPSSKVIDRALCVAEFRLTTYAFTASLPAEKKRLSVLSVVYAEVATVPAELVLQKLLVPHVPVGVAPAPAREPLLSQ